MMDAAFISLQLNYFLFYTINTYCTIFQGSTGEPKAALATHFKMVNNAFLLGKRIELSDKHHTICVQLPPFHIYGTLAGIVASLHHGSTIVLPTNGYQPSKALDVIKNEKYVTTINQIFL